MSGASRFQIDKPVHLHSGTQGVEAWGPIRKCPNRACLTRYTVRQRCPSCGTDTVRLTEPSDEGTG